MGSFFICGVLTPFPRGCYFPTAQSLHCRSYALIFCPQKLGARPSSLRVKYRARNDVIRCFFRKNEESVQASAEDIERKDDRVPFDLNLAVVLAGFAFEAYTSPPDNVGTREIDAAECQTVYLSEQFLREVYDGQLIVNLKKGVDLPAMDPWVEYKSFEEIDREKQGWKIPFVSDLFGVNGLGSALKFVHGSESVQTRKFVEFAFGRLKSLTDNDVNGTPSSEANVDEKLDISTQHGEKISVDHEKRETDHVASRSEPEQKEGDSRQSYDYFWMHVADVVNQTVEGNVIKKLGFPVLEKLNWDGYDIISRMGMLSMRNADEGYVESGLASPEKNDSDIICDSSSADSDIICDSSSAVEKSQSLSVDLKKVSWDMLRQADNILGMLMVLTAAFAQEEKESVQKSEGGESVSSSTSSDICPTDDNTEVSNMVLPAHQRHAEEMKALFLTAESAMEAWAMLATSLGRPSFIKSEFEKICFLDNVSTDTQVAFWRDPIKRRLVIAFRGTEQAKWKDLRTDLMLVPAGLNPERIGGDFKQEIQVHSGFLSAYDSVRNRILSLIRTSIGFVKDDSEETRPTWHVYVTGHSLGGALSTLLALELSSSQMAKRRAISVTMYNFGSPRVGNKRFAEAYNEVVKDSWRIVNHRDIIPTVPRLMGYCHVAQPIYLKAKDLRDVMINMELVQDGYESDVIGEYTPDALVGEFMKGEKQLIEKILQTEISLFRSVRDGSALMQHMEDFYYITLLESVRANIKGVESSSATKSGILSA
ncbi:putative feruloyl esterase A [Nymphaea thermarum]|nr:putative feruloyl esterase A [Nymphaea thermarum]